MNRVGGFEDEYKLGEPFEASEWGCVVALTPKQNTYVRGHLMGKASDCRLKEVISREYKNDGSWVWKNEKNEKIKKDEKTEKTEKTEKNEENEESEKGVCISQ